jgi:hypothetical protein
MMPRWLLLTWLLTPPVLAAEMRFWTNTTGQIIEAEMTGVNTARRAVQVRLKDGSSAEIQIENLSQPDKDYARQQWASMQASPSAPTTPAATPSSNPKLPPRWQARATTDARLAKVLESGGGVEVEAAVVKSLDGFKSRQNADGSWGRGNKAAMTGFALQCYYGHGDTPDSSLYGDAIRKGLSYLIDLSKANPHGMLSENWQGGKGGSGTYEHAIAAKALGEACLMARYDGKSFPGMREAFEAAVKLIIAQQNHAGSWTYGGKIIAYQPESKSGDLSLANWHFLVLDLARESQWKIDALDACIQKAVRYIKKMQSKDGGFGGANRESHYNQWSLTGGALAGLYLMEGTEDEDGKKASQFLTGFLAAEPPDWNVNANLYCWHGYAQALCLEGGPAWRTFASAVLRQTVAAQQEDGSFKRARPNYPAGDAVDETYRQALCTLLLETPYRCAPN